MVPGESLAAPMQDMELNGLIRSAFEVSQLSGFANKFLELAE